MATLPKQNAVAGIDWILNPAIDFGETDTAAAERALGGGFSGSPFAVINNLRLRDSERMNRIALGNQLLNPFLEREQASALESSRQAGEDRRLAESGRQALERLRLESAGRLQLQNAEERARLNLLAQEGAQAMARLQLSEGAATGRQGAEIAGRQQNLQTQLAADSARQAIEEAGLDRRLGQNSATQLQLAILRGDQEAAQQLIQEAGADRRQASQIAAGLATAQLNNQAELLRTLIGANTSPRGGATPVMGATSRGGTIQQAGVGTANIFGAPQAFNPTARGITTSSSGGPLGRYTTYINNILRQYNL